MPKKFPWNTSLDEILQSDSNVIVEDTGVGTVTINIDGSPVGVFSSTGLVVTGTIGGDVEHLKLSGATKVSAVGEGARITSSAGYLAELTYSGTEFRIESRLHGGTFKLQAESSGGSDRRILNADPDGNLDLYYPKDNVAVLTLTDVTGSGAYGVNMTGVSGNFGTWFFSGPTMAFTNQTAGGGMGFNAKQTGGAFVTGFYFDPDGPSKIVHPATDANILESLATGIIIGDGTITSETTPITNGDTAQFKVTGNDLDIQVDQASGAINLLSSGAEVMLKATGDAAVALYYDGTVEGETVSGAFKATNGFQIASSGVTIDTIETTLTDDDTHFPTSGAVFDAISGFGAGDVVGPGSATDHAIARFNLATGKLIQNSLATIDDNGSINIPTGETYDINGTPLSKSDVGLGSVPNIDAFAEVNVLLNTSGFEDETLVALSTDSGNPPTITLTFTGTVGYWSDGVRYTKSGTDAIAITDVTGMHVIYYDGATLTVAANPSHATIDTIISDKSIVSIVYWNTNSDTAPVLANELHGLIMSGATHHYIHDVFGAAYESGAALSGYTLSTSSDAAISFDLTNLRFYDDDREIEVIDGLASVQYSQVLTGDAEIPVLYRDAVDQSWVEQAASTLPYLVGGTPRIQYMDKDNSYALTEVGANKWCSYWLVATNDWQYPIKMIPGDQEYNSANDALNNAPEEIINFGDLPSAEFIVMYQFVMKHSNGGTKNAQISVIADLRESGKSGTAANPATDHGSLSGLGDDDHPQYLLTSASVTNGDSHDHVGGDGAQIAYSGLSGVPATFAPTTHGNAAHSSTFIIATDVTYANLNTNGDVGTGAAQVAAGNHGHAQLHARSHAITDTSDHTATAWRIFYSDGSGNVTEVVLGADNTYLKSAGASAAPGFEALDISEDTSPTLGGDLVLDENSIKYIPGSLADTTAEGEVATMTIDAAAAVAFGDLLFMASDFELEQADASASATMPVIAMSLGTAEGSQDVLLKGFVRNDAVWNWSAGPIYVSLSTGLMTQTAPSGSGERVQRVGWAYSADVMFFDPDSTDIGVV